MPSTVQRGISEAEAKRFYDRYGRKLEWSDAFEGKAKRRAFSLLDAQPGQTVLEIGIGCGHLLSHAGERVGAAGRVVGIDLSETMLELGRERAPGACLTRASALDLPFADASMDWAFTSYVFDLLPLWAVDRALAELYRVLRPGAGVVLCGLTEGQTLLERAFMGMWKQIHRISPTRVGGCRPLVLRAHVERAGFAVISRDHVGQLGTPSEVFLARRP